mgnify:CR=1 FL=1
MKGKINKTMKPSERIKEIHRALKILDGQNPEAMFFNDMSFFERAILQYLDEKEEGTGIEKRSKISP